MVFIILNLPFSQHFATRQVNQILSQASVPIHLDAIKKILPGSVRIQGIGITGLQGDTIIYVGELQADIRLVSLLRSNVMLKEVVLEDALVELALESNTQKLNIAATFQSEKKKDVVPLEKPPAEWVISIKKGSLSNIHFRMNDSLSGIHIAQDASEIEIGNFRISLSERNIFCRSLHLGDADGLVSLTPRLIPPKKKKGSPWNMGFLKLDLDDVDFTFSKPVDSLELKTSVGKGRIRARLFDLQSRTVDVKLISFEESVATISAGKGAKNPKNPLDDREGPFQWNILSEAIEIKSSTASVGSEPGKIFKNIELQMQDLRLDRDQAGMKLKKIGFEMENGFSLEKMSGEFVSNRDQTSFHMEIKTANSQVEMIASAGEGYQDILAKPEEIAKAVLDLEQSRISLRDLSFFMEDMEELPLYAPLLDSHLDMEAKLNIEGPLFSLTECSVSQENNFHISLEGNIDNPFRFSEATADMDLEIFALDQVWVEKLADGFGISQSLPDLSGLKVQGNISDSLKSPDLHLELNSLSGNADLAGSFDFPNELFLLAYSFRKIALGELLSEPDLGFFTGAGEIKGRGFSRENLNASFYLQVDTLGFKGYKYNHTQLTGTLGPGEYELQMVANDSSLKGDMTLGLSHTDSAFSVQVSGILEAQLNSLHLYEDNLTIGAGIDALLTKKDKELASEICVSNLIFTTPRETAVVRELNASFQADSLVSTLHADADFFNIDLDLGKPLNELGTLGKGFQDYLASFMNPSHYTMEDRVSFLPEINGMGHISHHEVLDIFVEDTGFYFTNIDISMIRQADENSLRASVRGDGISYKMIHAGRLNAAVTDSAGFLFIELMSDSTSLFSGPENRWMLKGDFSNWEMLTRLSVDDYQAQNIYQIEVAGKADSNQIVLEIPTQLLTLNGEQWHLESPDLLIIDLASNTVSPALRMRTDSSFIHMRSLEQDQHIAYNLELIKVELESLISSEIITGKPEVTLSGSVDFSTNREDEKKIAAGLQLSDLKYSGYDFNDFRLDASFTRGESGAYNIDLLAKTDSSEIRLDGVKTENGDRNMDGAFSHFPLHTLEPFTEEYMSEMGGSISGNFNASSYKGIEQFNGEIVFEDTRLKVNMLNSEFLIPTQGIRIADEKMMFNNFTVLDTLKRPLKVDGFVDLGNLNNIMADLNITSEELQVMSRDKGSKAPFTGNIFVDSRVSIKGPFARPDISGRIQLSEGSEIFYHHMEDLRMTESEKIVNFVQHTSDVEEIDAFVPDQQTTLIRSSVETIIEIDPSTIVNFTLAKRMFDIDLNVKGGGNMQYNLENEQMTLLGMYEIGEGATLLKLVGWPDKSFRLTEGGFIRWDGRIENPELSLSAENKVSTSYVNPIDGKGRPIDFFVILSLSDYLSELDVLFTLRTPDQYVMSIINTLSPDEQMRQAISVLLFETIDLPGISSSTDYMTQQVNQILASQLNQLTKSTIKGVDMSFGLDTYGQSATDGSDETSTSLSYELSKSLLNNRAQIELSGRFSDDNKQSWSSDRSLNNVSFEYQLDSAASKYLKVYNEHTYDDVFEGEVIKTGIGFSYRKRYKTFRDIWKRKK